MKVLATLARFRIFFAFVAVSAMCIFFAVAVTAAPGDLDTTFDGDGKVTTNFTAGDDVARGVAIQSDGKIVTAGSAGNTPDFALARYNTDGSLDITFDGDGKVTTSFTAGEARARGVAIQADGKIVAVGEVGVNPNLDFALARYNADGSLDTTFGVNGLVTTEFNGTDRARGVAIQSDGKIVAVGDDGNADFALARYNTDGSLDITFDGDGKVTTDIFFGDSAHGVAIQSDGKIVAVGDSVDFALARYNADGSLDTTFDGDGIVETDFSGNDVAFAVAIQSDGKIVAVGRDDFIDSDFAIARYNADGSLDTTFDGDGKVTTDITASDAAFAVAIQSDGKIVAVGVDGIIIDVDFAIARYNADGSLDTTFDGDGLVTTEFNGSDIAHGVAIQSDGKIVAVGQDGTSDFALARYNANTPSSSSGGGGGGGGCFIATAADD